MCVHRNEEILTLWSIARFGSDVFLGRKDYDNDTYSITGEVPEQNTRDLILDTIFNDFW